MEDGSNWVKTFLSKPHGELSVLDNKAFAIAKQQWIAGRDREDHSRGDLFLLKCIQELNPVTIQGFWRKNFFLDMRDLQLNAVKDRLQKVPKSRYCLVEKWIASYEEWAHDNDIDVADEVFNDLISRLDGP